MLIECSPYSIGTAGSPNSRRIINKIEGYLLRVTFDFGIGYSVLQNWPELGEPTTEESLQSFKGALDIKALHALRVAEFSAFELESRLASSVDSTSKSPVGPQVEPSVELVPQHYLMPSFESESLWAEALQTAHARGFKKIKFKLGRSPQKEAEALNSFAKEAQKNSWRFDFNGVGTSAFLKTFSNEFDDRVELVEDPYPLQGILWSSLVQRRSWLLFADREKPPSERTESGKLVISPLWDCISGFVIKPSTESTHLVEDYRRVLWTSNMDHPLGHWLGLVMAVDLKAKNSLAEMGFQSIEHLEASDYSSIIRFKENQIILDRKTQWSEFKRCLNDESWSKFYEL